MYNFLCWTTDGVLAIKFSSNVLIPALMVTKVNGNRPHWNMSLDKATITIQNGQSYQVSNLTVDLTKIRIYAFIDSVAMSTKNMKCATLVGVASKKVDLERFIKGNGRLVRDGFLNSQDNTWITLTEALNKLS